MTMSFANPPNHVMLSSGRRPRVEARTAKASSCSNGQAALDFDPQRVPSMTDSRVRSLPRFDPLVIAAAALFAAAAACAAYPAFRSGPQTLGGLMLLLGLGGVVLFSILASRGGRGADDGVAAD